MDDSGRLEIIQYCKNTICLNCKLKQAGFCKVLIDRYGDEKLNKMVEIVRGK